MPVSKLFIHMRSENPTPVSMKIAIIWNMTPCPGVKVACFYCRFY
jgi:hypothetical protein